MKFKLSSTLLMALAAFGAQAQAASLQNGSFNQGLSHWQVAGDAAVRSGGLHGADLGNAPVLLLGTASIDFDDDAPSPPATFNFSGHAALETSTNAGLEEQLGLPTLALGTNAYEGSGALQTFSVNAGDTIAFDWRVLSRDNGFTASESDVAHVFWQAAGQTQLVELGQLATLNLQNAGNGWLDSGLRHFSFIASHTGQMTLGFSITDVNSFNGTSMMAVQNVVATAAVPEPESMALALVGLILLGRTGRRLHQK